MTVYHHQEKKINYCDALILRSLYYHSLCILELIFNNQSPAIRFIRTTHFILIISSTM